MSDTSDLSAASGTLDSMTTKTAGLTSAATTFSKVMTQAFSSSVASGQKFDDVLKSLALKMSDLATKSALQAGAGAMSSSISSLVSSLFGGAGKAGVSSPVKAFASGGVIGTPSYFPMPGGTGLAGESGPEAIMPLQRAADGSLGVAAQGGGNTINVQIATPDLDGFRRSENYVTGQIARAVARGQRSL
ncbi:phage-related minor tail protein [Tardiphaga robiniae]|uniref:phage tail tape measure protein n=1 Tax=Tardiphaga robiniae TaxID=943830 RepID=UPI002857A791|nr:phage tail tape measure protein [Tardiphaga robiniae]MDR6660035.1 phage-related minor tail protein [Tardiphaga robiniae]